jgi:UDP-3-O-[3-hydroxymyristoyl] N-acetylglucosamine deacetylase/3-hydroxyacyl-[acyl-carrier-protein] dehydratase
MDIKRVLGRNIEIEGIGLHTGESVKVIVSPAEEGNGIRFIRTDVQPEVIIPAEVAYVNTTNRGTTLKSGEVSVSTVEHLLAAISALCIHDLNIYVNGPEIPILDGSSAMFYDKFLQAGLSAVPSTREVLNIKEPVFFKHDETNAEYAVFPSDRLELSVILEYPNDEMHEMAAVLSDLEHFKSEIADARTFVFLSEVEPLFDAGLIKGGDIDNAVVIIDRHVSHDDLSKLLKKIGKPDALVADGMISSTPLRFSNEPARHKLLDLIGDLYLLGKDVKAKIIATRPGHTANVELAKMLKGLHLEQKRSSGRPVYDPNTEPVMDVEQIKKYLPHRYPFLMVDKVIEVSDHHIVGIKNVTFNEGFFQGHFPDNPVFPGVLQMEALAQTGGILALTTVSDGSEKWDTYFLKMDNVKFKAKVMPGDTLILKMELMGPIRRGIIQMMGTAYVGSKLVSEGELTAQIVKRQNDQ